MKLALLISVFGLAKAYLSNGLLSISITRHHKGDVFTAQGGKCYKDFCVSLSSGTAAPTGNGECECKCGPGRPVFRDDLNICVDDIPECSLVPFASGSVTKKIPYVFLPLKGQIVYPSADIIIPDVEAPVCVVSGGQFLGQSGWLNLRNSSGTETPFRLFRDEGRTYLQWLGETPMRMAMEGRIILIHLMCKDSSAVEEPKVFTPCIGFRVAGNPSVKEMMFTTDVHLKEERGGGLSVREYVAIGVCSLLLAVVYVAAVALYLYIRRRKQKGGGKTNAKSTTLTLGEEGVIKSNPLLQAGRHLSASGQDNPGYVSESNSCCSDTDHTSELLCLDDEDLVGPQNMQTAVLIHPCDIDYGESIASQDPNNMEKLPEENVSIVETLEVREHPETVKGMGCGNGRRKLYFNPSYFEPDLLKAPPPAAVEFLIKIREVIAIAKHKMSAKKFSPSLLGIPEEDSISKTEHNSSISGRKGTPAVERCDTKTPRQETAPLRDFHFLSNELCWPSDTKQKIIRKWLEDVPFMMLETDEFKAQKTFSPGSNSKVLNKSKLWQMNEKCSDKESIPRAPARQERRKAKGKAPPVPPLKTESKSENVVPPHPPPMPAFNHDCEEIPRVQGKDCVPPAIAKNLMDAVIQELTTFKKNDKSSKLRDLPGKVNDTWQENKERLSDAEEKETDTGPAAEEDVIRTSSNFPDAQEAVPKAPQDDHEYEIILLNADQPSGEGKEMKIYNLPEILSKSDRSEGYSLVSEVYVNDGYSCCSGESPSSSCSNESIESDNVHYDVPNEKSGRLTIHVNDSPDRYKTPAESDNFEPDTLDRKPRRSRLLNPTTDDSERYSNQKFHDMECCINSNNSEKFTDSLERPSILLKTNGTFKRNSLQNNIDDLLRNFSWNKVEGFGSLREIYEAKSRNPKRKKTSSLIGSDHGDQDRTSTLSWSEERRNKLLHRGIILHINEEGSRRKRRESHAHDQSEVLSKPPKPSPTPRSGSASPVVSSNCASPTYHLPLFPTSPSPPLPPPRSVPVTPPPRTVTVSPPRLTSSSSPQLRPHSKSPSPTPPDRRKASTSPLPHSPPNPTHTLKPSTTPPLCSPLPPPHPPSLSSLSFSPASTPPPPRPPKTVNSSPVLPPRNTKPPLPPKNLKRHPKPGKFAGRPLPPLPRPTKDSSASPPVFYRDPDTLSTLSGASIDSLNSSDYEAFYTLPYTEDEDARVSSARNFLGKSKRPVSNPITILRSPINDPPGRIPSQTCRDADKKPCPSTNKRKPYRPEDSGYLSTDSDSCCPQFAFPPHFSRIPENGSQNSETDESLCDGASESGGESIATDSFFYGNFNSKSGKPSKDSRDGQPVHPCALGLSDVEVNSDTERRCVPIMVRP